MIINEENKNFIKKYVPNSEKVLESTTVHDALVAFSDWLDTNPDCWETNGYDYSNFGRKAQKVYDDMLYDNVYANKELFK
ncbi:MAG: hypothetical protein Q4A46_07990 [Clostridia bacterium]|nr:hypothetical protein [Clostridia bacterium]